MPPFPVRSSSGFSLVRHESCAWILSFLCRRHGTSHQSRVLCRVFWLRQLWLPCACEKKQAHGKVKQERQFCASSHVHSVFAISKLATTELIAIVTASPVASVLDMLWDWNLPMRLGDCPAKMQSRRMATRKKEEKPFDKCTCEYYSGSRKGAHRRKFASEVVPSSIHNVSDLDEGDEHGQSSTLPDTVGSDLSCAEADAIIQHVRPCGSSCRSHQSVELGKVNGLPIRHAQEEKPSDLHGCNHATISSPAFESSVDESNDTGMNKTSGGFPASSENGECVYDIRSDCEVSQGGLNEEETRWEIGSSALSLSPTRGGHRRTFPPPLSSVATQSYCDILGKSPGACSASYCLRSFRCNGRFVLQEVKAPTHNYFRVSREDGRLKLELIKAVNESSADEEEASASDAYVGGDKSDSVVEMAAESSGTIKVCAEDACEGSTSSRMLYAECTCIASTQVAELITLDSKAGMCMEGYEDVSDVMDAPTIIAGTGKPLKHVVPDVVCTSSAAAPESPSSPRCIEVRARYTNKPSPTMKSRWARTISAF